MSVYYIYIWLRIMELGIAHTGALIVHIVQPSDTNHSSLAETLRLLVAMRALINERGPGVSLQDTLTRIRGQIDLWCERNPRVDMNQPASLHRTRAKS